jgi:hypothetical protein
MQTVLVPCEVNLSEKEADKELSRIATRDAPFVVLPFIPLMGQVPIHPEQFCASTSRTAEGYNFPKTDP